MFLLLKSMYLWGCVCMQRSDTWDKREHKSGLRFAGSLDAGLSLFGLGSFQGGCSVVHGNRVRLAFWQFSSCSAGDMLAVNECVFCTFVYSIGGCAGGLTWSASPSPVWVAEEIPPLGCLRFCTDKAFPVQYKSCFPVPSTQAMRMTRKGEEDRPHWNDQLAILLTLPLLTVCMHLCGCASLSMSSIWRIRETASHILFSLLTAKDKRRLWCTSTF